MTIKKITSVLLLLLIFVGAIGGIGTLTGKKEKKEDYTNIQSLAEYVSKLYLTVDKSVEERKNQLKLLAPDLAELIAKPKNTSQRVQQVKAGEVNQYANGRFTVSVETWTIAMKKEKIQGEDGKEEEQTNYISRRYVIDLDIVGDASNGFVVSGLPKLREIPITEWQETPVENALDEKLILPIIEATFPKIFEGGDISSISNYFSDDAVVSKFPGGYKFQKVISTQIYKSGKTNFRILVLVKVLDPVTETSIGLKVTTDWVMKNEKYYLKNVF